MCNVLCDEVLRRGGAEWLTKGKYGDGKAKAMDSEQAKSERLRMLGRMSVCIYCPSLLHLLPVNLLGLAKRMGYKKVCKWHR